MAAATSPAARPFEKVVCVGLDGATFDVIDPMIEKGRLPHLAKLLSAGVKERLWSTVPPLSAPAWVSFMTGLNPGRHGVFHFRAMERGALGAGLVGSWAYRGRTIFDYACRAGLNVLAFRVPMTYPAWPVNGVMVSGFPTPDPRVTYSEPPEVGERIGPLMKLGAGGAVVAGVDAQIENFNFHQERSTQAVVELLASHQPDLFCYVNSVTDWMAHKFWRYSDPSAPGYEPHPTSNGTLIEHFYEQADRALGEILDVADERALTIVLSDHGMGRRSLRRFNTNAWLEELGLLVRPTRGGAVARLLPVLESARGALPNKTGLKQWVWKKVPPLRTVLRKSAGALPGYGGPIDWEQTQAYRVAVHDLVQGINVNLEGREPHGRVRAADFEAIRQRILDAAAGLVDPDTGARILEGAYRREDLYSGEFAELAPDIVLVLNAEYEFGPGTARRSLSRVSASRVRRSSANHRPDGILAMAGPGIKEGSRLGRACLIDVPATILWALGLEVPEEMDGRVLTEAFDDELAARHPVRRGSVTNQHASDGVYSRDEERQLAAHLRDLGYL
jgi:predicted AlkP superfamily phosphohydrolase/phosphomutase